MRQLLPVFLEIGILSPLLLLPVAVLHTTRVGHRNTALLYSLFALYLAGIYTVVGLPNLRYIRFEPNLQLIPLLSIPEQAAGSLLNILLFVPMGLFLNLLWGRYYSFCKILAIGAFLSFAIEVLQMFTSRATDINDLITNCLGTSVGYLAGKLLLWRLPGIALRSRKKDLPLLLLSVFLVMFLFQSFVWDILY